MKSALTIAVLIIATTILTALHLDAPITCVLPFLGGLPPNVYDFVGVAVILTTLWGLHRLGQRRGKHP